MLNPQPIREDQSGLMRNPLTEWAMADSTPPATDREVDRVIKEAPKDSMLGRLWDSTLGDEEWRLRKAMILNSMRLNPDAALTQAFASRIKDLRETRRGNRTADALLARGLINENQAEMIRMGLDYKDVLGQGKEGAKAEMDLRKELAGTEASKNVSQVAIAFDRINAVAEKPSAAGDLALIFNYMKMLDPGSVVRESEFATAAAARAWMSKTEQSGIAIPGIVKQAIQKIETGQMLLPEQREDFIDQAGRLYNSAVKQYEPEYERYSSLAKSYGYDPSRIARKFERYTPKENATQIIPPVPAGENAAEWPAIWNAMTPEQKALFSGAK